MVRRINSLLAATALCCGVFNAQAAEIKTNMAHMQAMDKITGKVSEIDVPVGGEALFGSFSIVVRACMTRPPEEAPENFAFVDVVDNYKTVNPINIFKGWMMSSSPALNAVEHPIYDVWLLKCYDGELKGKKQLSADALKARDEIPMQRSDEKPADIKTMAMPDEAPAPTTEVPAADKEKIQEEAQPAPVSETISVVVTDVEPAEDGAPKALLDVKNVAASEESAVADDTVSETSENVSEAETSDVLNDGSQPETLINFEEIEEDGFELNTDAQLPSE